MSQGVKRGGKGSKMVENTLLVGMTNSLVALNLEIWEILILTSKGEKGVKRDPKLQKKPPYLHKNCSIRVETCR